VARAAFFFLGLLLDEGRDLRRGGRRPESAVQRHRPLTGGARSGGIPHRLEGGTEIAFDLGQRVGASLPPHTSANPTGCCSRS